MDFRINNDWIIWVVFGLLLLWFPIRSHVTLEVVYDVVPKKTKRIFSIISMLTIIIAFIILILPQSNI